MQGLSLLYFKEFSACWIVLLSSELKDFGLAVMFLLSSPSQLLPKASIGIVSKSGCVCGGEKCAHMMGSFRYPENDFVLFVYPENEKASAFSLKSSNSLLQTEDERA